jgi:hypothetical protein
MVKLTDDIYKQIMWDYNIPKEDVEKLLSGEAERAGHYNRTGMLVKLFNNLNWHDLLKLFSTNEILSILTDEFIQKIRFQSLRENYETVRKILRREPLSAAKWNNSIDVKPKHPLLSHRWYSIK